MGCVSAKEKIQSRILTLKLKRACIEKERTENALALSGILGKRIYRQPVKRYVISKKNCVIEEESKNPRNPKRRRRSMDDFSDKEEAQDQQDLSLPLSKKKNYTKKKSDASTKITYKGLNGKDDQKTKDNEKDDQKTKDNEKDEQKTKDNSNGRIQISKVISKKFSVCEVNNLQSDPSKSEESLEEVSNEDLEKKYLESNEREFSQNDSHISEYRRRYY